MILFFLAFFLKSKIIDIRSHGTWRLLDLLGLVGDANVVPHPYDPISKKVLSYFGGLYHL
jgi:hypothetical protein